jgi:hypothetical protein
MTLVTGNGPDKGYLLSSIQIMGNLLYIIAVVLIIGWVVGFFAFHVGGIIHILLVIALISIILRVIQGRKPI